MNEFYVYIIKCNKGSYYTGHTDNLEKRMSEHLNGTVNCWTTFKQPLSVVYVEQFGTRSEALEMERRIKKWSRAKKEALMSNDWQRLKELSKSRQAID